MIGKLSGIISLYTNDQIIIDVCGVGYLVYCSTTTKSHLTIGELNSIFIETYVREDHIHLYGFFYIEEKDMFNILRTVNGISPRLAMVILSTISINQIYNAIQEKDINTFNQITGIGKKLSERIVIELQDKNLINNCNTQNNNQFDKNIVHDAILVLTHLGINKIEAKNTIIKIMNKHNNNISIDDLIKEALNNRVHYNE